MLNALKNCPAHRSTLVIGDSNTHAVNQREVDPVGRSIAVRSVSGLCVVAAVYALKNYKSSHNKVKKLAWSIGVNDWLHKSQHCLDDWDEHLKSLFTESARIFPNASISVILPFHGLPKVPDRFLKMFENKVKSFFPRVKRLRAPSMTNMVGADGVHLNKEGISTYFAFLQKQFAPKVSSVRGTQKSQSVPNTGAHIQRGGESFRLNPVNFPPMYQPPPTQQFPIAASTAAPNHAAPNVQYNHPPQHPAQQVLAIRELTEVITQSLLRGCGPPQHYGVINYPNR